jgi:hypothetical protein
MDYKIDCKNKARKFFMLALMPSILSQLGLTNSKHNVYITVEKMTEDGGTQFVGTGYVVSLNTGRSVMETAVTLCHELVHVKQMISGKLSQDGKWCGRDYSGVAYLGQPWELQAMAQEQIIFRRAFETL